MNELALLAFPIVIVVLLADRYLQEKRFTEERKEWVSERSRLLKAVMAKNINEYSAAVMADKVTVDIPREPDEVPQSEASDELFDKHIKSQTQ